MNLSEKINFLALKTFKSVNDINFCNRVWSADQAVYQKRLKALGFHEMENVLDAGFGMMQWSYALSKMNNKVYGIEFSNERYKFACELAEKLSIQNFFPYQGSVEDMPYEDEFFDGIFSYSVVMLTDYRKSLREFYRTMKKGAFLYFNANGLGWYIYNIIEEPNKSVDFSPRERAIGVIRDTLRYYSGKKIHGNEIIIDKDLLYDDLVTMGFKNIVIEGEGKINITDEIINPFFKETYYNQTGVFEVLCQK